MTFKTAKFRGVPFEVETGDDEVGGARNIIHEFPGRIDAEAESAGNFPRRFTLEAHLIGEGFEVKLADLESALRDPGEGVLEHPTRGKLTVVLDGPVRAHYDTRTLGIARLSLTFCEVGEPGSSQVGLSVDTGLSLLKAVADVLDGMRLPRLDLSGFNFVQQGAHALLAGPRSVTNALRQINARVYSTVGIVEDFSQAIDDFVHEVDSLLDTPATLAIKLQGLMNSVLRAVHKLAPMTDGGDRGAPGSRISVALQNLSVLGTVGDQQSAITGTSASRAQQRSNQEEIVDLVEASALAMTCALLVDIEIDSFAAANNAFAAMGALFDRLLERGTLDDDVAQRLRDMRAAFYAHLRRAVIDVGDLDVYTPAVTGPALLVAWHLYGDATRAAEIVNRNAIEHPGFVPGGIEIAVAGG